MLKFHVHSAVLFLALLAAATGCSFILYRQSFVSDPLLPREHSVFAWDITSDADAAVGGSSRIEVKDASSTYDFNYTVTADIPYPYVTYGINFTDHKHPVALADWTAYEQLHLRVKCQPQNVLSMVVHTYDDEVTRPEDFSTYRKSETFFSCGEQLRDVTIDLTRLETPEWWLRKNGLPYSRRSYQLDRVASLTFHNSYQSPQDIAANVQVSALFLQGRDWRFIYAAVAFNVLV